MGALGEFSYRLSGARQRDQAVKASDEGHEHVSDAITLYEAQQAVVLAAHGSFAIGGAPTSEAFNDVLSAVPVGATAFFAALGVLGATQVVMLALTRLTGWHVPHWPRLIVLLVSVFAFMLLAGAWFQAGSEVAFVTMLALATSSLAGFYNVFHRNGR